MTNLCHSMVNPLMGAKMEPMSGLESGHSTASSVTVAASGSTNSIMTSNHLGFVKLELDPHHHLHHHHHQDKEEDGANGGGKVEVKMEVLGELFGYGFGCDTSSLLGDGGALSFGGVPSASFSPEHSLEDDSLPIGGGLIRTVKVHHHHHSTEDEEDNGGGGFPPVLSIPASFAGSPVGGGLHISLSPISQQGADTTSSSMASPPTPLSATSSTTTQKKTVYTAKGNRGGRDTRKTTPISGKPEK